ncbi:hypothetical protein LXL04_036894 [Taraxacum kok-saghyz]
MEKIKKKVAHMQKLKKNCFFGNFFLRPDSLVKVYKIRGIETYDYNRAQFEYSCHTVGLWRNPKEERDVFRRSKVKKIIFDDIMHE